MSKKCPKCGKEWPDMADQVGDCDHHRETASCIQRQLATMTARAEEAEARLRVAGEAWPKIRDSIHAHCHNRSVWDAVRDMKEALSGDLPPCPGCAKANAKLAAVGHVFGGVGAERLERGTIYIMKAWQVTRLLEALASDPEVIAVVDGWIPQHPNFFPWVPACCQECDPDEPEQALNVQDRGGYHGGSIPVTVTVTRKGEGE